MNNKMIKLLAAVAGLLLMSPLSFAGSEPNPGAERVDGMPVIRRVSLSIVPSAPECMSEGALTGVDCVFGDLTIVGRCKGIVITAGLKNNPLENFGLAPGEPGSPGYPLEDITDISEVGLEGRLIPGLGNLLATLVPELVGSRCPVAGRDYEIRKVQRFVNDEGLISAVIQLVPQD